MMENRGLKIATNCRDALIPVLRNDVAFNAGMDSRIAARARRLYVQGLDADLALYPNHTVFGQAEPVLLLEVDKCGHTGS